MPPCQNGVPYDTLAKTTGTISKWLYSVALLLLLYGTQHIIYYAIYLCRVYLRHSTVGISKGVLDIDEKFYSNGYTVGIYEACSIATPICAPTISLLL